MCFSLVNFGILNLLNLSKNIKSNYTTMFGNARKNLLFYGHVHKLPTPSPGFANILEKVFFFHIRTNSFIIV